MSLLIISNLKNFLYHTTCLHIFIYAQRFLYVCFCYGTFCYVKNASKRTSLCHANGTQLLSICRACLFTRLCFYAVQRIKHILEELQAGQGIGRRLVFRGGKIHHEALSKHLKKNNLNKVRGCKGEQGEMCCRLVGIQKIIKERMSCFKERIFSQGCW